MDAPLQAQLRRWQVATCPPRWRPCCRLSLKLCRTGWQEDRPPLSRGPRTSPARQYIPDLTSWGTAERQQASRRHVPHVATQHRKPDAGFCRRVCDICPEHHSLASQGGKSSASAWGGNPAGLGPCNVVRPHAYSGDRVNSASLWIWIWVWAASEAGGRRT